MVRPDLKANRECRDFRDSLEQRETPVIRAVAV